MPISEHAHGALAYDGSSADDREPIRSTGSRVTWRRGLPDGAMLPSQTLFKYRLEWANGSSAGRAAYNADIAPGDIIADYRGQWLRVLAHTPIDDDSVYNGVLKVEPA